MPILARHRWLHPIDWRELSVSIRFRRAKGRCEGCGRPHGRDVLHLGDGRWWDEDIQRWRCGQGKRLRRMPPSHTRSVGSLRDADLGSAHAPRGLSMRRPGLIGRMSYHSTILPMRRTRVVLATCHLDHDPQTNAADNLAALCQRCHLLNDAPEHSRRRAVTVLARGGVRGPVHGTDG